MLFDLGELEGWHVCHFHAASINSSQASAWPSARFTTAWRRDESWPTRASAAVQGDRPTARILDQSHI